MNSAKNESPEILIKNNFAIADEYMELGRYDSAQEWLNKIAVLLPLKKHTLFNYFLTSRQAEVYYYNGLQRLGLQEAEKALKIAEALKDSLLLADSYNFLGLFYLNPGNYDKSIYYLKKALLYMKYPPYSSKYISLTNPHHILGNLAEAMEKTGNYNEAIRYGVNSLQAAKTVQSFRGVSLAYVLLASVYIHKQDLDSSIYFADHALQISNDNGDFDVNLMAHGLKGYAFALANNREESLIEINKSNLLLNSNPGINSLFYTYFLGYAEKIYEKFGEEKLLVGVLKKKTLLEEERMKANNEQMGTLLNASLENETRLLNLEVKEAKEKQRQANLRLILALFVIAILFAGVIAYRYILKQKIKLANLRQEISQDLHDDIGASLSSLKIYSAVAQQTFSSHPAKAYEMIGKISEQSKNMMENMSDIVWSMKNQAGSSGSLETKIKNFGTDLLKDKNIAFTYDINSQAETALLGLRARKNIILVIKEAMNNIAKYSNAKSAGISLNVMDQNIVLKIEDDGDGFDITKDSAGNGLDNMQKRLAELNGKLVIKSAIGKGTSLVAIFPLTAVNGTGW